MKTPRARNAFFRVIHSSALNTRIPRNEYGLLNEKMGLFFFYHYNFFLLQKILRASFSNRIFYMIFVSQEKLKMIFFCHKKISKMFFFLLQENCKKIFLNRQKNLTRFCCNKGTLKKGKVN